LKENPSLLAQLSEMLAQRQLNTEDAFAKGGNAAAGARQTQYTASFIHKLRGFFEL
jgi:hypothetical protein